MNKNVLILACGLFYFLQCGAQVTVNKDSLFRLLKTAKEDTSKVMLLLSIADLYETNNQDSSMYFLEESKKISKPLQFTEGLFRYHKQTLIVSYTKGNYSLALLHCDTALSLARQLKDSMEVIKILVNKGNIYQYTGQFERQLEHYLVAIGMMEKLNLSEKIGSIYQSIANAYYNLGQYRKSLEYCQRSFVYGKNKEVNGYFNRLLATFGQCYQNLRMPDSALHYFKLAVAASAENGDRYAEGSIYGYMANDYAAIGDFKAMLAVSEKSLSISRELQSSQMLASSLYNLAYAQFLNNDSAKAKKSIDEALAIAEKDSLLDELKNIYTVLSYIAAKNGDYKTSVWAYNKADSIRTVFNNDAVVKSTGELEKKYESEKKDSRIKLQQAEIMRKNTLNYILIGSAFSILVIAVLGFRTYRHKQKLQQQRINELETEKQLAATEAVLKGEEQERTRLAKDLHDGLGGMLSGIKYSLNTMKGNLIMTPDNAQAFERSMDMLDSSIKEMRRVAHNLMPEALVKFGLDAALKDFSNDVSRSGALNVNYQSIGMDGIILEEVTAITIYRIVQELLNNTMKYAAAKNAIVQLTKSGNQLALTVEDDGKGFDTNILKTAKGMGWANIENRIGFLKGSLDLDSQTGKGTSVHIEIKL